MPIPNPLPGPKAPTRFWPASPVLPNAPRIPKPHNLCHEPLLQDTSSPTPKSSSASDKLQLRRHSDLGERWDKKLFRSPRPEEPESCVLTKSFHWSQTAGSASPAIIREICP